MNRYLVITFLTLLTFVGTTAALGQDIIALGDAPAASFVVPYFASDTAGSDLTTLFSITNVAETPAIAHVTLWTQAWQPTLTFDVVLGAHDLQPLSLATLLNGSIPATDPRGMPGCVQYPEPALSTAEANQLKADHTGLTCLGDLTDPIATGFITVDAVSQCTPLSSRAYDDPQAVTPLSPGYFAPGGSGIATNSNRWVGDYHLVNRQQNFAQGGTPIHLRADAEMFSGDLTFYSFLSGGADNRSPLADTIYGRFLNGGLFDGGTDLLIFRVPSEYVPAEQLTCGVSPWNAAENGVNMVVFDEAGQSFLSQRPFRWGTESTNLQSWPELPTFGALTLQFPDAMQGAGLTLQNANGRFSTGFDMTPVPRQDLDENEEGNPQGFRVDFQFTVVDQQVVFQGQCFDDHSPVPCQNPNWHFGDGAQDEGLNPTHTYAQGGIYSVTFIAETEGAKASRSRPVTVEAPGGGNDFSVAFTAVQTPNTLNVQFTGTCFLGDQLVTCQDAGWDFGDGSQGNGTAPPHTFPNAGTFTVTFTASADGQTDSQSMDVTVQEPGGGGGDLSVAFTAVQTPDTLSVRFTGSCFLEGQSVTCQNPGWDFGDGSQGTGATATHTFPAAGTFAVTFSAAADGQIASQTMDVVVQEPAGGGDDLSVTFTAVQTPQTLNVQFTGSCFLGGQSVACQNPGWNFGDGSQGTGTSVTHTFPTGGTFTVTFTASADGQTDSQTMDVIVEEPGGDDELSVTFTAVQTPNTLSVQFTGSCFLGDQSVPCQAPGWSFGDGSQGSGTTPTHTFPNAGTFTVTFTASANGQTDSQSMDVAVQDPSGGAVFDVDFSAQQTADSLSVQFTGSCSLDGQNVTCQNPGWDFGDGTQGSGTAPEHTYADAGTFTVTFTASANGQTDSKTLEVTVDEVGGGEVLDVNFTAQQVPDTLNVQFTGTCSLDGQDVPCQNPAWDFGDGTQGSGTAPDHTYPNGGMFTVIFTASADGQTDSKTLTITVEEPGGGEVFDVDFMAQQVPDTLDVQFTGTCSLDGQAVPCQNPDWDFGDGSQSNAAMPTHTFEAPGTYDVTYTASNNGQTDSQTLQVAVEEPNTPPVISGLTCLPNPLVAGRVATCTFVVADSDGDDVNWRVTTDTESNTCVENLIGGPCTQTVQGVASGETTVPFNLLSTAGFLEDAFLEAEATDERGADAEAKGLVVGIEANNLPAITTFECTPSVVLPGTLSACTLVFADLDQDTVDWTITITQGTEVCLDSNPGPDCVTTIGGSSDQFPLTVIAQLRTALTTPGQQQVLIEATLSDGLDTVQDTEGVTIP